MWHGTGRMSDRAKVTVAPQSLWGQCGMLALVSAGTPSYAQPPPPLPGVVTGRAHASCECHVLRRAEEVGADPIFSA
jgi:hypothetical protein